MLCRPGGDEFFVILPNTTVEEAIIVGEKIRAAVEKSLFVEKGGQRHGITVSIGTATFPACADDAKTLIEKADQALYLSKKNGRNRVTRSSSSSPIEGPVLKTIKVILAIGSILIILSIPSEISKDEDSNFASLSRQFQGYLLNQKQELIIKLYNKGIAAEESGDYAGAVKIYSLVIEKDPKFYPALISRSYIYILYAQQAQRNPGIDAEIVFVRNLDKATADLIKAQSLIGDDPDIFDYLGLISYLKNEFPQAIDYFQKAIELRPKYPVYHNDLSSAYYHLGEYNLAREALDKAIELDRHYYLAYKNRVLVRLRLGDYQGAMEDLHKYKGLNPLDFSNDANMQRLEREIIEQLNKMSSFSPSATSFDMLDATLGTSGHWLSALFRASSPLGEIVDLERKAVEKLATPLRQRWHTYENILKSIERVGQALQQTEALVAKIPAMFQADNTLPLPGFSKILDRKHAVVIITELSRIRDILGKLKGTKKKDQVYKASQEIEEVLGHTSMPGGITEESLLEQLQRIRLLLNDRLKDLRDQKAMRDEDAMYIAEEIERIKLKLSLSGITWGQYVPIKARSYLVRIIESGLVSGQLAALGHRITKVDFIWPEQIDLRTLYTYPGSEVRRGLRREVVKYKYARDLSEGQVRKSLRAIYGEAFKGDRRAAYATYDNTMQQQIIKRHILTEYPEQDYEIVRRHKNIIQSFRVTLIKIGSDISGYGDSFIRLEDKTETYAGFMAEGVVSISAQESPEQIGRIIDRVISKPKQKTTSSSPVKTYPLDVPQRDRQEVLTAYGRSLSVENRFVLRDDRYDLTLSYSRMLPQNEERLRSLVLEFTQEIRGPPEIILSSSPVANIPMVGNFPEHKNTFPVKNFNFKPYLFHLDKDLPWKNPNLITLWLEAFKQALTEELNAGGDFVDVIIYPRGGILYKKFTKVKDCDLTFYLNDWVYDCYSINKRILPYARIVNSFIKLTRSQGLSIVQPAYHGYKSLPEDSHANFIKFPVRVKGEGDVEIGFHIFDARLSLIDPANVLEYGGLGFAYDPEGNYYGDDEIIKILNRYVTKIDCDKLLEVKYRTYMEACRDIYDYAKQAIKYPAISYEEFMRIYLRPFSRVITLYRLIGDLAKVETWIKRSGYAEWEIENNRSIFQGFASLRPYYYELMELSDPKKQDEQKVKELIRQRFQRIRGGYQRPESSSSPLTGEDENKKTILVVDDEASMRTLLEIFLQREGYIVYTVENGKEAIEILLKKTVDLVLTDFRMPVMDGLKLCNYMSQQAALRYIPVIMITGFTSNKEKLILESQGMLKEILIKPFNFDQVSGVIKNVLQKAEEEHRAALLEEYNRVPEKDFVALDQIARRRDILKDSGLENLSDDFVEGLDLEKIKVFGLVIKVNPELRGFIQELVINKDHRATFQKYVSLDYSALQKLAGFILAHPDLLEKRDKIVSLIRGGNTSEGASQIGQIVHLLPKIMQGKALFPTLDDLIRHIDKLITGEEAPANTPQKNPMSSPIICFLNSPEDFTRYSVVKDTLYHALPASCKSHVASIAKNGFNLNTIPYCICRAFGQAIYLATTEEEAVYWAKQRSIIDEGIIILPVKARIKNPKTYTFGPDYREKFARIFPNGWSKPAARTLQERLKEKGCDSIILKSKHTLGLNQVIVFDPTNVMIIGESSSPISLRGPPYLNFNGLRHKYASATLANRFNIKNIITVTIAALFFISPVNTNDIFAQLSLLKKTIKTIENSRIIASGIDGQEQKNGEFSCWKNGKFDLSKAQYLRITFPKAQAGIKIFVRLLTDLSLASCDVDRSPEIYTIPEDGVVIISILNFSIVFFRFQDIQQITVYSGAGLKHYSLGQSEDKKAEFIMVEVLNERNSSSPINSHSAAISDPGDPSKRIEQLALDIVSSFNEKEIIAYYKFMKKIKLNPADWLVLGHADLKVEVTVVENKLSREEITVLICNLKRLVEIKAKGYDLDGAWIEGFIKDIEGSSSPIGLHCKGAWISAVFGKPKEIFTRKEVFALGVLLLSLFISSPPLLIKLLNNFFLRDRVIKALGEIRDPRAKESLIRICAKVNWLETEQLIVWAVSEIRGPRSEDYLVKEVLEVEGKHPEVRKAAAKGLARREEVGLKTLLALIKIAIKDEEYGVSEAVGASPVSISLGYLKERINTNSESKTQISQRSSKEIISLYLDNLLSEKKDKLELRLLYLHGYIINHREQALNILHVNMQMIKERSNKMPSVLTEQELKRLIEIFNYVYKKVSCSSSPIQAEEIVNVRFKERPSGSKICIDAGCCFLGASIVHSGNDIAEKLKKEYGDECGIIRKELALVSALKMGEIRDSVIVEGFPCWALQMVFDYSQVDGLSLFSKCGIYDSRPPICHNFPFFVIRKGICIYENYLKRSINMFYVIGRSSLERNILLADCQVSDVNEGIYFTRTALEFLKAIFINTPAIPIKGIDYAEPILFAPEVDYKTSIYNLRKDSVSEESKAVALSLHRLSSSPLGETGTLFILFVSYVSFYFVVKKVTQTKFWMKHIGVFTQLEQLRGIEEIRYTNHWFYRLFQKYYERKRGEVIRNILKAGDDARPGLKKALLDTDERLKKVAREILEMKGIKEKEIVSKESRADTFPSSSPVELHTNNPTLPIEVKARLSSSLGIRFVDDIKTPKMLRRAADYILDGQWDASSKEIMDMLQTVIVNIQYEPNIGIIREVIQVYIDYSPSPKKIKDQMKDVVAVMRQYNTKQPQMRKNLKPIIRRLIISMALFKDAKGKGVDEGLKIKFGINNIDEQDQVVMEELIKRKTIINDAFANIFLRPDLNHSFVERAYITYLDEGGFKKVYKVLLKLKGKLYNFKFLIKIVKIDVEKSDTGYEYNKEYANKLIEIAREAKEKDFDLHLPVGGLYIYEDPEGKERIVFTEGLIPAVIQEPQEEIKGRIAVAVYLRYWKAFEKQLYLDDPKYPNVVIRKTRGIYRATIIDIDNVEFGSYMNPYKLVNAFLWYGFTCSDIVLGVLDTLSEEEAKEFIKEASFMAKICRDNRADNLAELFEIANGEDKYKLPDGIITLNENNIISVIVNERKTNVTKGISLLDLMQDCYADIRNEVIYNSRHLKIPNLRQKEDALENIILLEGDNIMFGEEIDSIKPKAHSAEQDYHNPSLLDLSSSPVGRGSIERICIVGDSEEVHEHHIQQLVELANKFLSRIYVQYNNRTSDLKNIIDSLPEIIDAVVSSWIQVTEIKLIAEGEDAVFALDALATFISGGFEEGVLNKLLIKKENNSVSSPVDTLGVVNPYSKRDTIRGFQLRNEVFAGELYWSISETIRNNQKKNVETDILWIGPGKGYELYELMWILEAYDGIDLGKGIRFYPLSKEDLIERNHFKIIKWFKDETKENIPEDKAENYSQHIVRQSIIWDLNLNSEVLPLENREFDIIVIGNGTSEYLFDKVKIYNALKKRLKEGGAVFVDLFFIEPEGVLRTINLWGEDFIFIPPAALKITNNNPKLEIPLVFMEAKEEVICGSLVPGYRSYYQLSNAFVWSLSRTSSPVRIELGVEAWWEKLQNRIIFNPEAEAKYRILRRGLFGDKIKVGYIRERVDTQGVIRYKPYVECPRNLQEKVKLSVYAIYGDRVIISSSSPAAGKRVIFVYPFMGPDGVPAMLRETFAINDDLADFGIAETIIKRVFGRDYRINIINYQEELDAMVPESYKILSMANRRRIVFVMKGFDGYAGAASSYKKDKPKLLDYIVRSLKETDMVLVLNPRDICLLEELQIISASDEPLNLHSDSLSIDEQGNAKYQKYLYIPKTVLLLEKKGDQLIKVPLLGIDGELKRYQDDMQKVLQSDATFVHSGRAVQERWRGEREQILIKAYYNLIESLLGIIEKSCEINSSSPAAAIIHNVEFIPHPGEYYGKEASVNLKQIFDALGIKHSENELLLNLGCGGNPILIPTLANVINIDNQKMFFDPRKQFRYLEGNFLDFNNFIKALKEKFGEDKRVKAAIFYNMFVFIYIYSAINYFKDWNLTPEECLGGYLSLSFRNMLDNKGFLVFVDFMPPARYSEDVFFSVEKAIEKDYFLKTAEKIHKFINYDGKQVAIAIKKAAASSVENHLLHIVNGGELTSASPITLKLGSPVLDIVYAWFYGLLGLRGDERKLDESYRRLQSTLQRLEKMNSIGSEVALATKAFNLAIRSQLEKAKDILEKIGNDKYIVVIFLDAFLEYCQGRVQECWQKLRIIINNPQYLLDKEIKKLAVGVMVELLVVLKEDRGFENWEKEIKGLLGANIDKESGFIDENTLFVLWSIRRHYVDKARKANGLISRQDSLRPAVFLIEEEISLLEQGLLDTADIETADLVLGGLFELIEFRKSEEQLNQAQKVIDKAMRYFPDRPSVYERQVYLYTDYVIRAILESDVNKARDYFLRAMEPGLLHKAKANFKMLEFYRAVIEFIDGNIEEAKIIIQQLAIIPAAAEVLSKFYTTIRSQALDKMIFDMLQDKNLSRDIRFSLANMLIESTADNLEAMSAGMVSLIDANFQACEYEQAVVLTLIAGMLDKRNKEVRKRRRNIEQFLENRLKFEEAVKNKDFHRAQRYLRLACGFNPHDAGLEQQLKDISQAITDQNQAANKLSKVTSDYESFMSLAKAQLNRGKFPRAMHNFREAIEVLSGYSNREIEQLQQKANQEILKAEDMEKEAILRREQQKEEPVVVDIDIPIVKTNANGVETLPKEKQVEVKRVWMTAEVYEEYQAFSVPQQESIREKLRLKIQSNKHSALNKSSFPGWGKSLDIYKIYLFGKKTRMLYVLHQGRLIVIFLGQRAKAYDSFKRKTSNTTVNFVEFIEDEDNLQPVDLLEPETNSFEKMPSSSSPVRILVAEDSPEVAEILVYFISKDIGGVIVELVGDGEAAMEKLRQGDFDLLVTDLNMPRMNGDELVKQAQSLKPTQAIIMETDDETVLHPKDSLQEIRATEIKQYVDIIMPKDTDKIVAAARELLEKAKKKSEEEGSGSPVEEKENRNVPLSTSPMKSPEFSERQRIALKLLCQNESYKGIGSILHLSHQGTVKKIVHSILDAFGLGHNIKKVRPQLIEKARQLYPDIAVNLLTDTEKDILALMQKGKARSGDIAVCRGVHIDANKRHIRGIKKKLEVNEKGFGPGVAAKILEAAKKKLHSLPQNKPVFLSHLQIQALLLRAQGLTFEEINDKLAIVRSDIICGPAYIKRRAKVMGIKIVLERGSQTKPYATSLKLIKSLQLKGQIDKALKLSGLQQKVKQEKFGFAKLKVLKLLACGKSLSEIMAIQGRSSYSSLWSLLKKTSIALEVDIKVSEETDFLPLLRKTRQEGLISGYFTIDELVLEIERRIEDSLEKDGILRTRLKVLEEIEIKALRGKDDITLAIVQRYRQTIESNIYRQQPFASRISPDFISLSLSAGSRLTLSDSRATAKNFGRYFDGSSPIIEKRLVSSPLNHLDELWKEFIEKVRDYYSMQWQSNSCYSPIVCPLSEESAPEGYAAIQRDIKLVVDDIKELEKRSVPAEATTRLAREIIDLAGQIEALIEKNGDVSTFRSSSPVKNRIRKYGNAKRAADILSAFIRQEIRPNLTDTAKRILYDSLKLICHPAIESRCIKYKEKEILILIKTRFLINYDPGYGVYILDEDTLLLNTPDRKFKIKQKVFDKKYDFEVEIISGASSSPISSGGILSQIVINNPQLSRRSFLAIPFILGSILIAKKVSADSMGVVELKKHIMELEDLSKVYPKVFEFLGLKDKKIRTLIVSDEYFEVLSKATFDYNAGMMSLVLVMLDVSNPETDSLFSSKVVKKITDTAAVEMLFGNDDYVVLISQSRRKDKDMDLFLAHELTHYVQHIKGTFDPRRVLFNNIDEYLASNLEQEAHRNELCYFKSQGGKTLMERDRYRQFYNSSHENDKKLIKFLEDLWIELNKKNEKNGDVSTFRSSSPAGKKRQPHRDSSQSIRKTGNALGVRNKLMRDILTGVYPIEKLRAAEGISLAELVESKDDINKINDRLGNIDTRLLTLMHLVHNFKHAQSRMLIVVFQAKEEYRCYIWDMGKGFSIPIEEAFMPNVSGGGGSGVGLYFVKRDFVGYFGGKVRVSTRGVTQILARSKQGEVVFSRAYRNSFNFQGTRIEAIIRCRGDAPEAKSIRSSSPSSSPVKTESERTSSAARGQELFGATVTMLGASCSMEELKKYLGDMRNSSEAISKVIEILKLYSGEGKQILLELCGGKAAAAYAIAKNNKDKIGVISIDLYDVNHGLYGMWARDFEAGKLNAQKYPLDNLVLLRGDQAIFKFLPTNCIDYVFLVAPSFLQRILTSPGIKEIIKPGGKVIVKPYQHFQHLYGYSVKVPEKIMYEGYLFQNTYSASMFGVDIDDISNYRSNEALFIWQKDKLNEESPVSSSPAELPFLPPGSFDTANTASDKEFWGQMKEGVQWYLPKDAARFIYRKLRSILPVGSRILDLMSGYHSYTPRKPRLSAIVGLGVSTDEMRANRRLTSYVVCDINVLPNLPFCDNSFDAIIMTSGIAYVKHPFILFKETNRILKPGGIFAVVFGENSYALKTVRIWRENCFEARLNLVRYYFEHGGFKEASVVSGCFGGLNIFNFIPMPPESVAVIWAEASKRDSGVSSPIAKLADNYIRTPQVVIENIRGGISVKEYTSGFHRIVLTSQERQTIRSVKTTIANTRRLHTGFTSSTFGIYAPSSILRLMDAFKKLGMQPGETLIDLGSGNGAVVLSASALFRVQGVGLEINAVNYSRSESARKKLEQKKILSGGSLRFINNNFIDISWRGFDYVYYYSFGVRHSMFEEVIKKLMRELKVGGRFLILGCKSNRHSIMPFFTFQKQCLCLRDSPLFRYESISGRGLWVFTRTALATNRGGSSPADLVLEFSSSPVLGFERTNEPANPRTRELMRVTLSFGLVPDPIYGIMGPR